MLPACIAQFFASWLSLMTSGLASASPGRAARPSKTPHVHVRVSSISFSFACCLADGGRTAARGALLSTHYIPAPKKITCALEERGAATVPKPNSDGFAALPQIQV